MNHVTALYSVFDYRLRIQAGDIIVVDVGDSEAAFLVQRDLADTAISGSDGQYPESVHAGLVFGMPDQHFAYPVVTVRCGHGDVDNLGREWTGMQ